MNAPNLSLFGLPAALTAAEGRAVADYLTQLWQLCYAAPPGTLDDDVAKCRRYFDPVARGATLRARLAQLPASPPRPALIAALVAEPVTVQVDEQRVLAGVEARLVLEALRIAPPIAGLIRFGDHTVAALNAVAAQTYRSWAWHRLEQVIALRQGRGKEVLQAVGVGITLTLLVNRSTDSARAVAMRDPSDPDNIGAALHRPAEAFAAYIANRNDRSASEQRIRGGYALTEAQRRLGELLKRDDTLAGPVVYIAPGEEDAVIDYLATDLARRPNLDATTLATAFDALVEEHRVAARNIALHAPTFERPANTSTLRDKLLRAFEKAQAR